MGLGGTLAHSLHGLHRLVSPATLSLSLPSFPIGALVVGAGLGLLLYLAVLALEHEPSTTSSGTVPLRLLPARESQKPPQDPTQEISKAPVEVRVHSATGSSTVRMVGAGSSPSVSGERAVRFVTILILGFIVLSVPLLLFYPILFESYDHVVAVVGWLLYWPDRWPGVYAIGVNTLVVPDYIFPMYLAFMGSFAYASGLIFNHPRHTRRRRLRALSVVIVYVGVELLLDALFFTIPGATLRSLALLVRVLTGGLFMALLTFCAFYLPTPQKVTPRAFPRDRVAIAEFLGLGVTAVALSAALLLLVSHEFYAEGIDTGFTVLLLLPVISLPIFAVSGRAAYFHRLRKRPLPPLSLYHPPVSIIIPAYNEEEWISACVESVDRAAAHYPGEVEVIVGNDGSTDRTSELARDAIKHLQHCTGLVVDLPHGGKSNALNGALALANGEIVLRVDGDTILSETPGFAAMISHFADPNVGGVQGGIHPRQTKGWTRKLRALEVAWVHYLLRPASMATRSAEVLDGLFSAFRRVDLVELGGWVPWNGEDSEISMRVQRLGYQVRLEFGALAWEDVPRDYDSLRRQRVRWSRGIIMANGQHYPALLGPTPEFGGLGVLFWFLLLIRSGVRNLVYVYLALLILFLGVPGLIYTVVLLGIATGVRAIPIGYFLVRMGRADVLPWIPFFPIANIVKQNFRFEAFGTLGPGATAEYV